MSYCVVMKSHSHNSFPHCQLSDLIFVSGGCYCSLSGKPFGWALVIASAFQYDTIDVHRWWTRNAAETYITYEYISSQLLRHNDDVLFDASVLGPNPSFPTHLFLFHFLSFFLPLHFTVLASLLLLFFTQSWRWNLWKFLVLLSES